jgi:putative colanic acid biosynthesis UDP-glucose lipid carrier transferase
MRNRHKFSVIFCFILSDLLAIIFSSLLFLRFEDEIPLPWTALLWNRTVILSAVLWILITIYYNLYFLDYVSRIDKFYHNTWRALLVHCILWHIFIFVFEERTQHKLEIRADLLQLSFILFYFFLSRIAFTIVITQIKKWVNKPFNIAIWGFNKTSIELASELETNNYFANFLGIMNDNIDVEYKNNNEFSLALNKAIKKASKINIHELYVVAKPNFILDLKPYFELADKYCIRLKFVPDFSMITQPDFNNNHFFNFHVITPRYEPLQNAYNRLLKRIFDVVFSLLVIVFILSWLFPVMSIIIKYQSKGPVLFKQLRTGKKNQSFWCFKFRSMKMNRLCDSKQAQKEDDRITPVGKFIRRTSLDELPQFFNVLLGQMSVVGPRPHMLKHTQDYNEQINNFMVRHFVKPGITGLAQVTGLRGETKEVSDMKRRVNADIDYMRHWSLMKDIKICFLTVLVTLKGDENAF